MATLLFVVLVVATMMALAIFKAPAWGWALGLAAIGALWTAGLFPGAMPAKGFLWALYWTAVAALALLSIAPLRRALIVRPAFGLVAKILPKVSDTEQQALDAGTVGFDAELFSGTPDWTKLRAVPPIVLTAEERAFLDGPVEELCNLINDWDVRHAKREIPEEIWAFVKKHGFLGMLISKSEIPNPK